MPPDARPGPRSAAFFDLDKTIIARSSTLAFSKAFFEGGLLSRRAVLRSAYANLVFGARGADHDRLEQMRTYLTTMIAGWDVEVVRRSVRETLHEIVDPIVYAEAVDLIEHHRAAGRDVVIVSASGSEVVEPIGELLGIDDVIATTLVEDDDGRYTGEVAFYAYGPHKATAMERLARERGIDLTASFAYSDSETDVPMLETVGHPFCVNPDRALRTIAEERDWPILRFERPVGLRRRLGLGARTGLAAVTVVAVATGVAVTLAVRRRRRPAGPFERLRAAVA
ncbi:HAD family hydrolase [Aeromicrobium sp. CF4.19]|uniref:HAD family hydrolase n=1 Tax=Aeromicrobium sp. CF4.19 TaxID=3373082 RepID=UPI003EE75758